ncbi:MAG: glycoside hydrolase 5 family protein [Planctomycetota bacterium]
MRAMIFRFAGVVFVLAVCANALGVERWSPEKARRWYGSVGVIKGCNYLPRSAVNMTEMWQASTFDPKTVDQELGWAQEAGYNSVRVFLQYLVWRDDADGLKKRIRTFLATANKHNISVMFILFCDCSFAGKEPYLGPQDDPVPGVHNSGWVPSPGLKRVTDRSVWPDLERYVKDIVGAFGQDPRVLIWDLYNEPGNSGMGPKSLPLVEAAFAWAREVHPVQPLTTGAWTSFDSPMSKRIMALSDIISFHGYDQPEGILRKIKTCQSYGRPMICTEWLRRQVGNTVASILPLFAKHQVGWYHWGLVAGRTQTYMHWGSKRGDPMPEVWQHDTFHQNGTPYDLKELELIRTFRFLGDTQAWNSVYLQNDCIRL